MKKPSDENKQVSEQEDELRPEYDEDMLRGLIRGGVRGKYVERNRQGTNVVKLAPDVAAVFPTEQAVNEALRKLAARDHVAA